VPLPAYSLLFFLVGIGILILHFDCDYAYLCGSGGLSTPWSPQVHVGKYVRYTPKQVKMLERVYSECPKPSWQAAAHQGLPHPQQHQAQAD